MIVDALPHPTTKQTDLTLGYNWVKIGSERGVITTCQAGVGQVDPAIRAEKRRVSGRCWSHVPNQTAF